MLNSYYRKQSHFIDSFLLKFSNHDIQIIETILTVKYHRFKHFLFFYEADILKGP